MQGWCVWITGLPGSGKSTIAKALLGKLEEIGIRAQILSSDMLRRVITPKPKYTQEERDIVYGAVVFIAKLLTQNGVNVIIDATGNLRKYREHARREMPKFMEAYVRCPLEVCIQREASRKVYAYAPKDIYRKAFAGESSTVPGVGAPYEEPLNPEVVVDSDRMDPEECANRILKVLLQRFRISRGS